MPSEPYDFWLLDLDGTLVDIDPSYPREVLGRVGDELGREFTDREAEVLWYGLGDARNEYLRRWGIEPDRFWEAFHRVEDPAERAEATYLYDDAALVADLDDPVGVVTHCQRYLVDPVLERLDVADWFDAVVCCTDETGWKPDPTPVRMAMSDLGVTERDAGVLAGDGPHDVGAAWNAGLDGVHVERHDPDRRGRCVLGDRRVRSLAELAG